MTRAQVLGAFRRWLADQGSAEYARFQVELRDGRLTFTTEERHSAQSLDDETPEEPPPA